MLGAALIVIVIAPSPNAEQCEPGACAGNALTTAFEGAARRVLGPEALIQTQVVATDPPDEASVAEAKHVDGVIELSFASDGSKARVHCYVSSERRWIDREISFGESRGSPRSETSERGRLLGFAVATMFSTETDAEPPERAAAAAASKPPASAQHPPPRDVRHRSGSADQPRPGSKRSIEFAGIASTGLHGNAAGLGASAGLRLAWTGPIWVRLFVAGRTGNIPQAQSSTRTGSLGGGLIWELLPETQRFELGARIDAFATYFEASHLSEDDIAPDRRSRWQAGGDLVVEGGIRITGGASGLVGLGFEGMLGKTEIYTHNNAVAVVPQLRAIAELGFHTRF